MAFGFSYSRLAESSTGKCLKLFVTFVLFLFHVADIATDIIACINYNRNGLMPYYKASLAFLIIPFIYVVFYCYFEAGANRMPFCKSVMYSFVSYCVGPLFPVLFEKSLSSDDITTFVGFGMFGSAYMEDIPQVIIALFFLFKIRKDLSSRDRLIAYVQMAFSAASGVHKLVGGAAKLGGGEVNCCGSDYRCPC
jgi:hypothetical protein